jgi:hypothetical protein
MVAIIGAVARLTDAGMTVDEAVTTVVRLIRELQSPPQPDRAAAL